MLERMIWHKSENKMKSSAEMSNTKNPYTTRPRRLQDVIAAIQYMATHETAVAKAEAWGDRFGQKPVSTNTWEMMFRDHPEFFRVYESEEGVGSYSLVLRKSQPRLWHRDEHRSVTPEEKIAMEKSGKVNRLTFAPLNSEQIISLVEIAIKLHDAELTHQEKTRWWFSLVGIFASVVAAIASVFVVYGKLNTHVETRDRDANVASKAALATENASLTKQIKRK